MLKKSPPDWQMQKLTLATEMMLSLKEMETTLKSIEKLLEYSHRKIEMVN